MQCNVSAGCVQLTAKLADSKSFEAVKESHDNFLGKALSSRSFTSVRFLSEPDIKFPGHDGPLIVTKFHNFDVWHTIFKGQSKSKTCL
jgi:hypothetical protein